jgi:integrase
MLGACLLCSCRASLSFDGSSWASQQAHSGIKSGRRRSAFRNFRGRNFNAAVVGCIANDPTFPKVTVDDLRHTVASLAISAGANVKAVQRMLGHASAAMTLDVYADLFDDDLDAVATVLNEQVARHL